MNIAQLIARAQPPQTGASFRPKAKPRKPHDTARICRGENHPKVKTKDYVVYEAKILYAKLGSYKAVGLKLGVSLFTVRDWIKGRTRT